MESLLNWLVRGVLQTRRIILGFVFYEQGIWLGLVLRPYTVICQSGNYHRHHSLEWIQRGTNRTRKNQLGKFPHARQPWLKRAFNCQAQASQRVEWDSARTARLVSTLSIKLQTLCWPIACLDVHMTTWVPLGLDVNCHWATIKSRGLVDFSFSP